MREIKFRAWDNDKMYKCIVGNTDVKDNDYICPLVWDKERKDWFHSDTCKIMQYIGLKDKNSKEIYEGDIVKFYSYELIKEYDICKIKWSGQYITYVAIDNLGNKHHIEASDKNLLQVIGNINENPELLEDED